MPATMKMLGTWNWYLPSWLGWLPRIGGHDAPGVVQGEPEPARA